MWAVPGTRYLEQYNCTIIIALLHIRTCMHEWLPGTTINNYTYSYVQQVWSYSRQLFFCENILRVWAVGDTWYARSSSKSMFCPGVSSVWETDEFVHSNDLPGVCEFSQAECETAQQTLSCVAITNNRVLLIAWFVVNEPYQRAVGVYHAASRSIPPLLMGVCMCVGLSRLSVT